MIRLDHVTVTVPGTEAEAPPKVLLDDINLELHESRVAVIGANGSGKSTLLRLLNGLRRPSQGTVEVQGYDTVRAEKRVRSLVGFIFTDPLSQLLMSTPIEDVELSLRSIVKDRRARTARARELLEQRNIGHTAHQSIYDLSGGERQLTALTSVLAVEPQVIVADEPTTLLDLRNRALLRESFEALEQQLVFSTHDLEFAEIATRCLVVEGGRIVADDEPRAAIAYYRRIMS